MLIKIDLSDFFVDHRSKALILLKQNAQIIQDLANRIKELFKINNFYLTSSDEYYLSPLDDKCLLEKIDIVRVRSKAGSDEETLTESKIEKASFNETEEINNLTKKKKRRHYEESFIEESTPKKNRIDLDDNNLCVNESVDSSTKKKNKKKEKQWNEKEEKLNNSLECNKKEIANFEDQMLNYQCKRKDSFGLNVTSLVEKYEHKAIKLGTPRPPVKNYVPLNRLGKVNIVKSIIVSNLKMAENEINENLNKPNDLNKLQDEHVEDEVTTTINNEAQAEAGCDSDQSSLSSVSDRKKKRRRVRKRKKKQIAIHEQSFPTISEEPLKPVFVKPQSNLHIRFENNKQEENNKNEEVDIRNPESTECNGETGKNMVNEAIICISDEKSETLLNGNEEEKIKESAVEAAKPILAPTSEPFPPKKVETVKPTVQSLSDEFIMKQPIMKKVPKIGDIVTFKIFRLNENYCPEISSYITGKVVTVENALLGIDVIIGLDQCKQPNGKLTLDSEDEKSKNNNHIILAWPDLLEPRLLYP